MKLFIPCFGKSALCFPENLLFFFIVEINSKFYVLFCCLLLFILSPYFTIWDEGTFSPFTTLHLPSYSSWERHKNNIDLTYFTADSVYRERKRERVQITGNTMIQL